MPITQQLVSRPSTGASHALAVAQVIQAMRAQLSEPLSLAEMAEIACLSPYHFNRIFSSTIGIPPVEFLAALRLNAAKRLLLTTSLSVTDVCFDLGYTSLGTFTQRFTHLIGVPPLQLRQLAQREIVPALKLRDARTRPIVLLAAMRPLGVSGTITTPGPFAGLIFCGLFPKPIPQHRPIACTTITVPGPYHISFVPDGQYYLLCAALPQSPNALTYLLPDNGSLVGISSQPILIRAGRASGPVNLALRPLTFADPPILGVFPPLLAAQATAKVRSYF